jgi:hypothetical protein
VTLRRGRAQVKPIWLGYPVVHHSNRLNVALHRVDVVDERTVLPFRTKFGL